MTMADRIVIMLDGTVQQVGPPIEVYQKPANRFVAAFIGSPSMNFLPIRLELEGGKLQVKGHGFRITLPPDKAAALKGDGEQDAVLGIRPENLLLRPPQGAEESQLRATVEIVEAVGSDIYLEVSMKRASIYGARRADGTRRSGAAGQPLSGPGANSPLRSESRDQPAKLKSASVRDSGGLGDDLPARNAPYDLASIARRWLGARRASAPELRCRVLVGSGDRENSCFAPLRPHDLEGERATPPRLGD